MSSITSRKREPVDERRCHFRHIPASIMYVTLGSGNGGIVLNLGVGGLAFQAAAKLNQDQDLTLQFKLAGSQEMIKAVGQVAWLGSSQKEAGIRFTDLPSTVEQVIAQWIAKQEGASSAPSDVQPKPTPISAQEGHSVPSRHVSTPLVMFPGPGTASRLPPIQAQAPSDEDWEDDGSPTEIPVPSDAPSATSAPETFVRQAEIASDVLSPIPTAPSQSTLQNQPLSALPPSVEFAGLQKLPPRLPSLSAATQEPASSVISASERRWTPRQLLLARLVGSLAVLIVILMIVGSIKLLTRSASEPPVISGPSQVRNQPENLPFRPDDGPFASLKRLFLGEDAPKMDSRLANVPVWTYQRSGFYYCAGSPEIEKLKIESFTTQGDALQSGYRPQINSYCY
jgi:hypothetical protein